MNDINSGNISLFERHISDSKRIAIVTHMKPDGDAMGSSAALYHFLQKMGRSPKIIINDPYPSYLSFLISEDMENDLVTFETDPSGAESALSVEIAGDVFSDAAESAAETGPEAGL